MKDFNKVIYIDVDDCLIIDSHPNEQLIQKIMQWSMDGISIIVWTSNPLGVNHAREAVKKCGLSYYVDICLPKPYTIVDDDHLEYYNVIDPLTLKWR